MNFTPLDATLGDNGLIDTRCNRPEGPNLGCSGSWSNSGDPTPFLQELINVGGVNYYHVIVGLPENGFAQEVFTKTNGSYEGGPSSASRGDGICRYSMFMFSIAECNISDPLGQTHTADFTGNGSGDPKAVTIRQIMGGTWNGGSNSWSCAATDAFCYEFIKDNYLLKPRVDMEVKDLVDPMQARFVFDMSNSDYNTNAVAGTMTNTLQFSDPFLADFANFDAAQDSSATGSTVTGGRYIFTGSGPTSAVAEPYIYNGTSDFLLNREWWIYKH